MGQQTRAAAPADGASVIGKGWHAATKDLRPLASLSDAELIEIRDIVRAREGVVEGMCHEIAPLLSQQSQDSVAQNGYFLLPIAELAFGCKGIAVRHHWNLLSDGTIIDAAFDQFHLGKQVGRFGPQDPMQDQYVRSLAGCSDHMTWIAEGAWGRDFQTGCLQLWPCKDCGHSIPRTLALEIESYRQAHR